LGEREFESMAESQIITIVLVHGAFAESLSNWKPVLELLLAKGYKGTQSGIQYQSD
jgi:hypothetical protein